MRHRLLALALAGCVGLAACGGSDDATETSFDTDGAMVESEAMTEDAMDSDDEMAMEDEAGTAPAAADGSGVAPISGADLAALAGREVIRTAQLTVETGDVDMAVNDVERMTLVAGGFLGSLDRQGGATPSATLVLRVPGSEFTGTMAGLRGLGTVLGERQNADDVTDQVVDVAARIAVAEASIDRVRALLEQAAVIGDIVALEAELSSRTAELESLKGRQRVLADQVSLATITLDLVGSPDVTAASEIEPEERIGFLGGLDRGWTAFVELARIGGVVAGALTPFVVALTILVAPLVWWRRRRRGDVATATPAPPMPPSAAV